MRKNVLSCLSLLFFILVTSSLLAIENGIMPIETPTIENPSFEKVANSGELPDQWRGSPKSFARDTTVAHTGLTSLRWTNDNPKTYNLAHANLGKMQPGASYTVSAWVKTQNVSEATAGVCVEWFDATGKWLGGIYPRGLRGTSDWKQISAIFTYPENASSAHITCYGHRNATGTAWFDDLDVQPYYAPCILSATADCYRGQTVGGSMRVSVGISYDEKLFSNLAKKKISLNIIPKNKVENDIVPYLSVTNYIWQDNVITFTFNADDLAIGKYAGVVQIPNPRSGEMETVSVSIEKFETMPNRKAYIDAHQRLIVDGKPFFPLGLYFHYPNQDDIDRLGKSPFNCIMSYAQMRRETLDALDAQGIASIYSVKDYYATLHCNTDEEGRKLTTKKVNELKDHPAIIAWYINDELPLTMLDVLTGHRDLLEELDPTRPTWAVLYQVNDIRRYVPTFDVIGTDPYPISDKPASMAYEWAKKTHNGAYGYRACWQVPQIFNWDNYRDNGKTTRTPSFDEMRAMTWMAIVGGANGIVSYSYYDLERNFAGKNGTPDAKKASFERMWLDVCRIGEEVKKYEDVLLSIDTPAEIERKDIVGTPEKPYEEGIHYRLYGQSDVTWILLVNTSSTETKTAQFTVPNGLCVANSEEWQNVSAIIKDNLLTVTLDALTPVFLKLAH